MRSPSLSGRLTLTVVLLVVISLAPLGALTLAVTQDGISTAVQSADLRMATVVARALAQYVSDAESVVREAPGRPKLRAEIRRADWPEVTRVLTKRPRGRVWAESEPGKGSTFFLSPPTSTEGDS